MKANILAQHIVNQCVKLDSDRKAGKPDVCYVVCAIYLTEGSEVPTCLLRPSDKFGKPTRGPAYLAYVTDLVF